MITRAMGGTSFRKEERSDMQKGIGRSGEGSPTRGISGKGRVPIIRAMGPGDPPPERSSDESNEVDGSTREWKYVEIQIRKSKKETNEIWTRTVDIARSCWRSAVELPCD